MELRLSCCSITAMIPFPVAATMMASSRMLRSVAVSRVATAQAPATQRRKIQPVICAYNPKNADSGVEESAADSAAQAKKAIADRAAHTKLADLPRRPAAMATRNGRPRAPRGRSTAAFSGTSVSWGRKRSACTTISPDVTQPRMETWPGLMPPNGPRSGAWLALNS